MSTQASNHPTRADRFTVAGVEYSSRLLVGTGKYKDMDETAPAIEASGAEIVTVAMRRTNMGQSPGEPNLLDVIPPERYTILPNTAGCYTAENAVRTCRLARELLDGHKLVKLEVLGDEKTLFPDMIATIKAAEDSGEGRLRRAWSTPTTTRSSRKRLEDIGCVAVMPLAAPIGSGLGIRNPYNIRTIVENAGVPVLVDAGVGTASDAAIAMELGCDGVLMNTAIAGARDPVLMAAAMRQGHRGRPRGLPRRAHAAQALCHRLLADRRAVLLGFPQPAPRLAELVRGAPDRSRRRSRFRFVALHRQSSRIGVSHSTSPAPAAASGTARYASAVGGDLLRRADRNHLAALVPALGPQVDHPVRRLNDIEVVLDDDDGVAVVAEAVQNIEQLLDVVEMEPRGGLVQDVERPAGVAFAELAAELDPLGLAAGERGGALAQA